MLQANGVRSTDEERSIQSATRLVTGISSLDEAKQASPVAIANVNDPTVGDPSMGRGMSLSGMSISSPFDLDSLYNAYLVDSYVYQSVEKYISLILRRGWRLDADNKRSIDYINKRLKAMTIATKIPTNTLLRSIIEDLVIFGNAYLIKVRARTTNPVGPGLKLTGFRGKYPIAGLYPAAPPTMLAVTNDKGKVVKWKQYVGGRVRNEWVAADVIHLKKNCARGAVYGVSHLVPVLEDIRILRQIEQNILLLLYRNLHPLTHIKVGVPIEGAGSPATAIQVGQLRLEHIKTTFEAMAPDSALITEADVSIDLLGSESRALRAEPYVAQFRDRAFAGLGVSDTVMGKSSTTNRSTAEQLAAEMHDTARAWQGFISDSIKWQIFFELLYEGGYDPLNREEDFVRFEFTEVDIDTEIKKEDHLTQLYVQNVITHTELREKLGLEPLSEANNKDTFVNRVSIPTALARSGVVSSGAGSYKMATPALIKPVAAPPSRSKQSESPQLNIYIRLVQAELFGLEEAIEDRIKGLYRGVEDTADLSSYSSDELKFSTDLQFTESSIEQVLERVCVTAAREGLIQELIDSKAPLSKYPDIQKHALAYSRESSEEVKSMVVNFSEKLYSTFYSIPDTPEDAIDIVSPHLENLQVGVLSIVTKAWTNSFTAGLSLAKSSSLDIQNDSEEPNE